MRLSQLCIQRPIFACVLSLVLVVLGLLGYQQLQWRFYPAVFNPVLSINTNYVGASAQQIELSITDKLESALAGVPDVSNEMSESTAGESDITLQFKPLSKQDFLLDQSQVLQAIASVRLPDAAEKPRVFMGEQGQNLLVGVAVSNPAFTQAQLNNYVNNVLLQQFEDIPGVGPVQVWSSASALRIALNPKAMATWGLTADQVVAALEANNISVPAGSLINATEVIPLNTALTLSTVNQFQQLVIANNNGHLIRLQDIAQVSVGVSAIPEAYTRVNGKAGAMIAIAYGETSNPLTLGAAVIERVHWMQQAAPPGMRIQPMMNFSQILQHSLDEVVLTIMEAIALVVIVTFLFLGSWRATLIPVVTIPVCLVSAFSVMFLLGFSINVMTLLAFVLAVGLVVDDAIVVLENTERHIAKGLAPIAAAEVSMREISFVVVAMTLCLLAVYMPTGFISNKLAVYFQEFAFTLAGAVLISGFAALTLSPMMCAYVLRPHQQASRYTQWLTIQFARLQNRYQNMLRWVLSKTRWMIVFFMVLLAAGGWLLTRLPTELLPPNYMNVIFDFFQGPAMANTQWTYQHNRLWVTQLQSIPDIKAVITFIGGGGNPANAAFNVIPINNNTKVPMDQLAANISAMQRKIPGISGGAIPLDFNSDNSTFATGSLQFYLTGLASQAQLQIQAQRLQAALQELPSVREVNINTSSSSQQYDISIDRVKAAQLGVAISDITDTVSILLGGEELTQGYVSEGFTYPIIVQLPETELKDFSVLKEIQIPSSSGATVPLSELVTLTPVVSSATRLHYNVLPAIQMSLTINAEEGYTLGQVVTQVNQVAHAVLGGSGQVAYGNDVQSLLEGSQSLTLIFIFGVIFIYLVLAALFESFLDPLIVLLTVPLSVVGALVALDWSGGSLNMFTGIGLVTLIGLVSKHGVLITRFANEQVQQGESAVEAVVSAAAIRLRPILMTTATMALGAMPLLFAAGSDAASRLQMGIVIVAGLLIGTLFSLWVVPVAYLLLKKRS